MIYIYIIFIFQEIYLPKIYFSDNFGNMFNKCSLIVFEKNIIHLLSQKTRYHICWNWLAINVFVSRIPLILLKSEEITQTCIDMSYFFQDQPAITRNRQPARSGVMNISFSMAVCIDSQVISRVKIVLPYM